MTPIEPAGAPSRGSSATQNQFSARSGVSKVQAVQSRVTSQAAAPIETQKAVVQSQSVSATRMDTPPPTRASRLDLAQPMTAVLLHELRLQQELTDLREEMNNADE